VSIVAALVLSLASAVALNWGWVAQHDAAQHLPALSLRAPLGSLRALVRDLSWLVGFLIGILGWALYIGALTLAPLSLVQGVSAGGIAVLAGFARRRGQELTRLQWFAVAVATVSLVLLTVSLAGGAVDARRPSAEALALWFVAIGVAALIVSSSGLRLAGGASLGIAAGALYGAGDIATKGAMFGGVWLALFACMLAAQGAAFAALQVGFQRGGALATAGTATLLTNALPIAAGIALFHERLPAGALGDARVLAFVLVLVAAALLTRPSATRPPARQALRRDR
jgi:hypothetical protein